MEAARLQDSARRGPYDAWLWEMPDLRLIEAAADGELTLARLRLGVGCVLLVALSLFWFAHASNRWSAVAALADAAALLHGVWIFALVRRRAGRSWIGFASALGDLTIVSLYLVGVTIAGGFAESIVHAGVYPLYCLVILSTAMRYDPRICIAAAATALVQYGAFLIWVSPRVGVALPSRALAMPELPTPLTHSWNFELLNLALMLGAGALALSLIARAQRLCTLSTRDALTGLVNRRFFDERLLEETERARRGRSAFVLALVDIDQLARVNQLGGHTSGDAALRAVVDAIVTSFRVTDTVARFGEDELALLLPEASAADVRARFESASAAVANVVLPSRLRAARFRLGISVGVVAAPAEADTTATALDLAARRLGAAKAAGGHCVIGPEVSDAAIRSAREARAWRRA